MKIRTTLLAVAATILLAGPAAATHFETLDTAADCVGWRVDSSLIFGSRTVTAYVDWDIQVLQDGMVVTAVAGEDSVHRDAPDLHASGAWGMEFCGALQIVGTLNLTTIYGDDTTTFELALDCECGGGDACHFTPGYWKNHPSAWPLTELTIGGEMLGQDELIRTMSRAAHGDATRILARHLVAAMLNVANGADDSIQPDIDAANDLLAGYPIGCRPHGEVRREALRLKNLLCAYNEMGCPDGMLGKSLGALFPDDDEDSTEIQSWGAVKSTFR